VKHLRYTRDSVAKIDPQKSEPNKAKHGIDFEEAQALWNDPEAVEVKLHYPDEERYARIAKLFD
jgi:uncharacterized DUF497 family protein